MFVLVTVDAHGSIKRYATSRKVAGSIPDEMDDFFNLSNPSGRTVPWG
jgi:hypothetical protein